MNLNLPFSMLCRACPYGLLSQRMTLPLACLIALLCCCLFFGSLSSAETNAVEKPHMILIKGAAGEEEFGKQFSEWAELWEKAAKEAKVGRLRWRATGRVER